MTAPVAQIIETEVGRAQRLSPQVAWTWRPDVVDVWLLTLGRTLPQWQALLAVTAVTGEPRFAGLQMYTHTVTLVGIDVDGGPITPRQVLDVRTQLDEIYQHLPVRCREGDDQAGRLVHGLVMQIMRGDLDPRPVLRGLLADWRLAVGLGISAALSPAAERRAEVAYVVRDEGE